MVQIFGLIVTVLAAKFGLTCAAIVLNGTTNDVKQNKTNGRLVASAAAVGLVVNNNDGNNNNSLVANTTSSVDNNNNNNITGTYMTITTYDPLINLYGNKNTTGAPVVDYYDYNVTVNTMTNAFENFPTDIMPEWLRNNGGIIFHIFFLAYCCVGLGVVCDLYFLPSLEIISEKLALPADIAGATFMAIGTSAPELFTSIIGVFVSQDDIGVGTILGTAVFNLIVIPAACGFAVILYCPKTPEISRFPILRDSIFYILTIIALILCIKDNQVDWIESLTLISLFMMYLVIMYMNTYYMRLLGPDDNVFNEETPLLRDSRTTLLDKAHKEWNGITSVGNGRDSVGGGGGADYNDNNDEEDMMNSFNSSSRITTRSRAGSHNQKRIVFNDMNVGDDEDDDNWVNKNVVCKWMLMPMTLLLMITLPKPTKWCFILTFTISVVWIGALTYVCVWMVTIIGFTFGLPDTVSGLTLLAAGTSVPELISSVLVVRKASQADMAICNSIGSNIFDILFCLGVPWLLKSVIWMFQKGTIDLASTAVPIDSTALPLTTFCLLMSIFALLATFQLTKWKLGLTVGIVCSIIYIIFVIISSVLEISLDK
ncbi:sodium/potassium/calcium exchanger 3-like [Oppia nitens]|uniref:sodium/potassium/calcium exchanger 3-like n=1 Tax=Oppia nitens TaxID=1686743 RepID=UPI0023D9ABF8|nr:sodium/potassium/calcium exchanger 3-like [Oppia nitens]